MVSNRKSFCDHHTDANQAVVSSYRYTPYGEMTITRGGATQATDPLGQYWGYTGRFADEESQLWYFRARYYSSQTGRFLQRDPLIGSSASTPYEFVRSNSVNLRDSSGLEVTLAERLAVVVAVGLADALDAREAGRLASEESMREARRRGLNHNWHNPADAYKHCLWACFMSLEMPASDVNDVLKIHEAFGNRGNRPQHRNEEEMDWANNNAGLRCAQKSKTPKDCIDCCRKSTLWWPLPPYPGDPDLPKGPHTPGPAYPFPGGMDGPGDSYLRPGYMPHGRNGPYPSPDIPSDF